MWLVLVMLGLTEARDLVIFRSTSRRLPRELSQPSHQEQPTAGEGSPEHGKPTVSQLHVESSVKFRYAHSRVTSRIANPSNRSQEVYFDLLLPETAFITSFIMEVEGKQYKAFLKEKETAKKEYDEAVSSGLGAAHVHASARHSNSFTISVNVEGGSEALFVLSYEELLTRSLGLYSLTINLTPRQVVEDLLVDVFIAEPTAIIHLQVPKIHSGNELTNDTKQENELVEIRRPSPGKAHIRYRPTPVQQEENSLLGGQLVVKYDVERSSQPGGQILVNDGYFVHFFAPQGLPPLRKLVVFVLDLSGSMEGRKLDQLKIAMHRILEDLGERDHFNIMDFSYSVTVHSLDSPTGSVVLPPDSTIARSSDLPPPYPTSLEYRDKAKQVISKMSSGGGTNIYDALKNALHVAQSGLERIRREEAAAAAPLRNEEGKDNKMALRKNDTIEAIIIFLTDGDPTVGITKPSKILTMVKEFNNPRCSIFSLGFGRGADMRFLRKLSLSNAGFARSIYEASDAALQLTNFYQEVASPLLSNVTFSYQPAQVVGGSTTKSSFPSLFSGSELVVAGRLQPGESSPLLQVTVQGTTLNGTTAFHPMPLRNIPDDITSIDFLESNTTREELEDELKTGKKKPQKKQELQTSLERVWAYLTIQQLVDQLEAGEGGPQLEQELRGQATALALRYKFVTPFTSLVVVKPNKTEEVSNGKIQPGDLAFKNKVAYLQGALYGFPTHYGSAAGPVDLSSSQSGSSSYASSTIDRLDTGELSSGGGGEDSYYSSSSSSSTEDEYHYSGAPGGGSDSRLYLEDISWLAEVYSWENSTLALPRGPDNTTQLYLFLNATSGEDYRGENCTLTDGVEGVCRHVTDCILPQFAFSLQEYTFNYFCLLNERFAGACCPELLVEQPLATSAVYLDSDSAAAATDSSETQTESSPPVFPTTSPPSSPPSRPLLTY